MKIIKLVFLIPIFLAACATEREFLRERQENTRECIERFVHNHFVKPQEAYEMCRRIYGPGERKRTHDKQQ